MRLATFSLSLLLFWAPACSVAPGPSGESRGQLAAEQERWQAAGLRSYDYDFQQHCFCVLEQVQQVTVEVRDGVVHRVVSRETGQEVPVHEGLRWHTVPDLFGIIAEAERNGSQLQEVRFDPELGYPAYVEIGTLASDAGVTYSASNLRSY
jgi:hypothetical protein